MCAVAAGGAPVDLRVPGRCASIWLRLALAYVRLGDARSAELALSEANLCDPEHPGTWGQLALLALQQVRVLVCACVCAYAMLLARRRPWGLCVSTQCVPTTTMVTPQPDQPLLLTVVCFCAAARC